MNNATSTQRGLYHQTDAEDMETVNYLRLVTIWYSQDNVDVSGMFAYLISGSPLNGMSLVLNVEQTFDDCDQ